MTHRITALWSRRRPSRALLLTLTVAIAGLAACDPDGSPREVEDPEFDRHQIEEDLEGSSDDGGESSGGDTGGGESCTADSCGCKFDPLAVPIACADTPADDGFPDDGWTSTGVGIEEVPDFDLAAESDPSTDKNGGKCYPPFPAGCTQLEGTGIVSVRWLEQFRQATASNPWVNAPLTFNELTDAQVDQVIANCKDKPTEIEKLVCAAKAVDVLVDGVEDKSGDKVCRHHMGSLYKVLKKMGYGDTATGSVTHAWNEVELDTNGDGVKDTILVLDSYNGIYYTVPK